MHAEGVEGGLDEVVEHFGLDAPHEHLSDTFRLNLLAQSMQLRRTALVWRQFFLRRKMCRQNIFDEGLLLDRNLVSTCFPTICAASLLGIRIVLCWWCSVLLEKPGELVYGRALLV